MKKIILFFLLFVIIACNNKESETNLIVTGYIKGLKKGTLYLKKLNDTSIVTVDSVKISGNAEYELRSDLDEPEIFYLVLDKNDTDEGRIKFFANKGITEINTSLKNFAFDAQINGSLQQKVLQEYNKMSIKFNNKNLDLIKENFDALRGNDSIKILESDIKSKNLLKSKYLYTINFALNNKTSHVAPYLATTEIYNAQLKYLDTIYVSLPDSIATSKYGKQLKTLIEERKELENQ